MSSQGRDRSRGADFRCGLDLIHDDGVTRLRFGTPSEAKAWLGALRAQLLAAAPPALARRGSIVPRGFEAARDAEVITTLHAGWVSKKGERVVIGGAPLGIPKSASVIIRAERALVQGRALSEGARVTIDGSGRSRLFHPLRM